MTPSSGTLHRHVKRAVRGFANIVLPQDCALCRAPSGADFACVACEQALPPTPTSCPVCAMPSPRGERCGACLRDAPSFCATIAAMPYVYPIDRVVQGLKYHARLPVAAWVAERLAAAIGDPGDINLVAPIPLGDDRLRERGFNQAWEIARRVARRLERPAIATAITRTRNTTAQTALAFTERRRNLRGAFRANAAVIGQHVALVDDVMTTGATLEEAARTALAGGALSVTCWVVARAYPGR